MTTDKRRELTKMTDSKVLSGRSGVAKFLNSYGFIWILALITFVFWFTKQDVAGIVVIFLIMAAVLVLCEDATPVIACFIFVFFVFSQDNMSFEGKELWYATLILPLGGFIYNVCKYKVKKFTMGGFSFAILIALIPWLLQGIGVENRDPMRAFLAVGVAIAFVIVYFFIYMTSRRRDKNFTEYVAQVFLAVGVMVSIEIIIFHLRIEDYYFENYYTRLGWGTRNPVAAVLAMVMPVTFFYSTKKNKFSFLFIVLGIAEYVMILLLQSRGVTLFATVALPVLLVYSMLCSERKLANIITCGVCFVVFIIILLFRKELILYLLDRLIKSKFDENGRKPLWEAGVRLFTEHPIFGVGFDYREKVYYEVAMYTEGPTYLHSTFIQIYAALGVVGGIAYAYLYYWRYRIAFTDLNNCKFAVLVGFVVFECYCFIDTVYFQPLGYFLMMIASMCMEKDLDKEQVTPLVFMGVEKLRLKRKTVAVKE